MSKQLCEKMSKIYLLITDFRIQASATLRPKPTAKAVGYEPPFRSSLHTPAHRARPAYSLRIRNSIRRSGRLRGIAYAPAQAFTE